MIKGIEIRQPDCPPYGYFHIMKIYEDRSSWPIAYIDNDFPREAEEFAAVIALKLDCTVINRNDPLSACMRKG